jgi:hypothetical protein
VSAAVLANARATAFSAATNLRGDAAGAAWTFLLPSLEFETALCIGAPSAATLRTLSRLGAEVVVACRRKSDRRRVLRRSVAVGAANAHALAPSEALAAARHIDLAAAFIDSAAPRATWLIGASTGSPRVASSLAAAHILRLTPARGDVHTAGAENDGAALAYLDRVAAPDGRPRGRARRALGMARGSRRGALAIAGVPGARLTAPAYVRAIARAAGVALDHHRAGVVVPSEYASRKALLFLFRDEQPQPEFVVKLTRDPAHNARLENEWRALGWLRDAGLDHPGVVPRPAFFGHHAGLAVLGESAVAGARFRERTTARADCAMARHAAEWLLELAAATAQRPADNRAAGAALRELLARFDGLYRLTDAHRHRLESHVEAIEAEASPMPLVMQHGDPGVWNLLVSDEGRPAFLDWEAAEREGMPLWDVFYFIRSFAVTASRAAGARNAMVGVERQLFDDRPVNRMLVALVDRQSEQLGLDRRLVEPLFVTCWMHRALKEATRLPAARLESGHYVKLVRLSLDQREAPGLRRLFGTGRRPF